MMKIVSVVPIARGVFRDHLTYFSAQEIALGDLVTVPVRQKMINALVVGIEPLEKAKTDLKKADFSIKKIGQVKIKQFLSSELIETANELADYYATSLGQVLKTLLPKIMFEEKKVFSNKADRKDEIRSKTEIGTEKLILQDTDEERLSYYKGLVREAFARNQTVFVCEPTLADLLTTTPSLEKGIAHYTILLHSKLNAKTLRENWQRVLTDPHPLLIIATPSFLAAPRADLGLVILDRENTASYHAQTRPFIDYRLFVEKLTEKRKQKLLIGDILLRPETMRRADKHELVALRTPKQRLAGSLHTKLIGVSGSEIWSDEARELLTSPSKEKIFLLANRRGLAPLVVCDDCGEAVICGNCASPLVLHKENVFRCHHCGEARTSEEKCRRCRSWRLRALGTGIDRVAKELRVLAPDRPVFQIDGDETRSRSAAELMIKKFLASPNGVLLGTELALRYLNEKVTHSVIVTIDAMLALPDFRINEKAFVLIARLRGLTNKELIIQTRQIDNEVLREMARGQLLEFYRREITERERFDYPPFKTFIKITHAGTTAPIRNEFKKIERILAKWSPVVYPSLHGQELNLLIKLEPEEWPATDLATWLKKLPPSFSVSINPESVL